MSTQDAIEILLADDDPVVRAGYAKKVRAHGWSLTLAADGFEALQAVRNGEFDVLLLDLKMPYRHGADVLRILRSEGALRETRVFLLAEPGDSELVEMAMREGADGVFDKSQMGPRDVISELQVMFHGIGRGRRSGSTRKVENVPDEVARLANRFRRGGDGSGGRGGMGGDSGRTRTDVPAQRGSLAARLAQAGLASPGSLQSNAGGMPSPAPGGMPGAMPGSMPGAMPGATSRMGRSGAPGATSYGGPLPDERYGGGGGGYDPYSRAGPSVPPGPAPGAHSYPGMPSHAGPMAGQSMAGQSMAGASVAGQSMAGKHIPQQGMVPAHLPGPPTAEPLPNDPSFDTVLNKMVGEAGRLAAYLGLPADFSCPVCRSTLILRLWPDPGQEATVIGHFFCPGCTRT